MPEFHLDCGTREGAAAFAALDYFTQGYVEAMFFTCGGELGDDLTDASFSELAPATLARIVEDCRRFQNELPRDSLGRTALDLAYDYAPEGYTEAMAGRDYWYTRNGHGTGFWDRGLGEVGDELSAACRDDGGADLYRGDDGLLYL